MSSKPLAMASNDQGLTLAERKLAGSEECLNCGTPLKGPYCYYCGQPDRNFMRFFPTLLRDLLEDMLDLDSRFMRTLKPLLLRPGRLTRDFMDGRRFRYTPPMRLYVFSSIVFFLVAALLSSSAMVSESGNHDSPAVDVNLITEAEQQQLDTLGKAIKQLPLDAARKAEIDQVLTEDDTIGPDEPLFKTSDISFNDKPWNRETNPVTIAWLPGWINDRINNEIEESPQKAEQINSNPNLIVDKIFDILPATMFVLLPVVALILKFWYLFARRYYVEHLIFSLHNHAFIFVSLLLIFLLDEAGELLGGAGFHSVQVVTEWLTAAIAIWVPVYYLISLRVVYQQGWFMTLGKFFATSISYFSLLTAVTSGVAIASFILL